jgi:ribosomal protein S18 acetylase RimI-like enzyme
MTLAEKRRAIRPLLDERKPADATAVYYAFYHPDEKTQLITRPEDAQRAHGYLCLARTGIDLFRPLVTLRLPYSMDGHDLDPAFGANLITGAIPEGMSVILNAPQTYRPLLTALFAIQKEQLLRVFVLDRGRFEPIINVLVTQSRSHDGSPRFVIRQTGANQSAALGEIVASAGVNWQSARFAEIYVHTKPDYRRLGYGRSVVSALIQHVLESGRTPLYVANSENDPSIHLAESVGFIDTGIREILIEATRNKYP